MKKIVITGPECSGKTTLTHDLGNQYGLPVLMEYAREYLAHLNRPYKQQDLSIIAQKQLKREQALLTNSHVICDTSFLVLKVWSQVKYGEVASLINDYLHRYPGDIFFLPHFDIPYEEDTLREHPQQRNELYEIYKTELKRMGMEWYELIGSREQRVFQACSYLDTLIASKS